MNLFQRIFRSAIVRAAQDITREALRDLTFATGNRTSVRLHSDISEVQAALKGYGYRCLEIIVGEIATTAWQVYRQTGQNSRQLYPSDHWAVRLLQTPNPFTEASLIWTSVGWSFYMKGNAFLYAPKNGVEYPVQFWEINPNSVEIIPDKNTYIRGYFIRTAVGPMPVDAAEMIHIRNYIPGSTPSPFVGYPIIRAVIESLSISYKQKKMLLRQFDADGIPPLVVSHPKSFSDKEWNNLKARWNEKFPHHQVAGILEGGATVVPLTTGGGSVGGGTNLNMTGEAGRADKNVQELCDSLGVPYSIVAGNFSNRSTAVVAQENFYVQTIIPRIKLFGEAITRAFQRYDPDIIVGFDPKQFNDPEFELRRLQAFGFVPNEQRALRGEKPIEGGDTLLVPSGYVPIDMLGATPEPAAPPAPTPAASLSVKSAEVSPSPWEDEEFRTWYWKRADAPVIRAERAMKKALAGVFNDMRADVLKNIAAQTKAVSKDDVKLDLNLDFFDEKLYMELFGKAVTPALLLLLKKAAHRAAQEIGLNPDDIETDLDKKRNAALDANVAKVKESVDTVKRELANLLKRNAGKTPDEVAAAITAKFNTYSDSRARAIANTSGNRAANMVRSAVWSDAGISSEWLSSRDAVVRLSHIEADGQRADAEGFFTVGGDRMEYPCGGSLASENVNCRCTKRPVIDENSKAFRQLYRLYKSSRKIAA